MKGKNRNPLMEINDQVEEEEGIEPISIYREIL